MCRTGRIGKKQREPCAWSCGFPMYCDKEQTRAARLHGRSRLRTFCAAAYEDQRDIVQNDVKPALIHPKSCKSRAELFEIMRNPYGILPSRASSAQSSALRPASSHTAQKHPNPQNHTELLCIKKRQRPSFTDGRCRLVGWSRKAVKRSRFPAVCRSRIQNDSGRCPGRASYRSPDPLWLSPCRLHSAG